MLAFLLYSWLPPLLSAEHQDLLASSPSRVDPNRSLGRSLRGRPHALQNVGRDHSALGDCHDRDKAAQLANEFFNRRYQNR